MSQESQGAEHIGVSVEQAFLGIDPGEKRIGVAYKAAGEIAAQPMLVLENNADIYTKIAGLAEERDCTSVIVGLPRNVHGNDTTQTAQARAFAGELADASGLHVIMYDEFGSSARARERLGAKTRAEEKRHLDAVAAAILIEDYIEGLT